MAVTVYRSTDGSAPSLTGLGGSLVSVLDACLVNGYTGKTAAGWTKSFSGTNAASYRQGGGNRFYLDVNDNGPGAATTQEARCFGYETMTALATGTGQFPTTAQIAAGAVIRKSAAATATTRTWTLVADDRSFYLLIQSGDTAGQWFCFGFGDFYSYLPATDNYRTMIFGRIAENSTAATAEMSDQVVELNVGLTWGSTGTAIARSYTGVGASLISGQLGDRSKTGIGANLIGSMSVPNPVDNNIWIAPLTLSDANNLAIRGRKRGFFLFLHTAASFADQDTVAGTGAYAGHTFLLFKTTVHNGAYCLDITGPWDTNP